MQIKTTLKLKLFALILAKNHSVSEAVGQQTILYVDGRNVN